MCKHATTQITESWFAKKDQKLQLSVGANELSAMGKNRLDQASTVEVSPLVVLGRANNLAELLKQAINCGSQE